MVPSSDSCALICIIFYLLKSTLYVFCLSHLGGPRFGDLYSLDRLTLWIDWRFLDYSVCVMVSRFRWRSFSMISSISGKSEACGHSNLVSMVWLLSRFKISQPFTSSTTGRYAWYLSLPSWIILSRSNASYNANFFSISSIFSLIALSIWLFSS